MVIIFFSIYTKIIKKIKKKSCFNKPSCSQKFYIEIFKKKKNTKKIIIIIKNIKKCQTVFKVENI